MSNVRECISIAEKIATGELSVSDGSMAILGLVHDNRAEAIKSMADAILNENRDEQKAA